MEEADGSKEWWVNGDLHRTEGPAAEYPGGGKEWYINGKPPRIDGPAVEYADGSAEWWIKGELHRIDGPAVELANGPKYWHVKGQEISTPYSYVLTAAFARGLLIYPEVFPDVFKAMSKFYCSKNDELNQLSSILHKYWPTHVKKILATLFGHPDPAIKQLAFSLLRCEVQPDNTQGDVRL